MSDGVGANLDATSQDKGETLPSLASCVEAIKKHLTNNSSRQKTSEVANLLSTCLAFMIHLKKDSTIMEKRNGLSFPPISEVPAISTLLQDRQLFLCFYALLTSTCMEELCCSYFDGMNVNGPSLFRPNDRVVNRKRSGSEISSTSENHTDYESSQVKSPKASGMSNSLEGNMDGTQLNVMSFHLTLLDISSVTVSQHMNFSIIAAVVFYSAFRYLDHWPVIFMKAYVDDFFGFRHWVDDERCALFVRNLTISLRSDPLDKHNPNHHCNHFTETFELFLLLDGNDNEGASQKLPSQSPSDITGNFGTNSNSIDEYVMKENPSNFTIVKAQSFDPVYIGKTKNCSVDSEVESSSNECHLKSSSFASFNASQALQRFSSLVPSRYTEIDRESSTDFSLEPNPSESVLVEPNLRLASVAVTQTAVAPWCRQDVLDLTEIRCRFFKGNKTKAFKCIGQAVSNLLDTKAKLNSRLLTFISSFLSVPVVRQIVASRLERWFHSPALYSLCRQLLPLLVNEIQCTEPPLEEDLAVIDFIVCMRLKSNQFTFQLENVASIIKVAPMKSVLSHIVMRLLKEELAAGAAIPTQASDHLQMLVTLVTSSSPSLAPFDCVATCLVSLLQETVNIGERTNHLGVNSIDNLVELIRRMASAFGSAYDGYRLIKALMNSASKRNMSAKSLFIQGVIRLLLESVICMVPAHSQTTVRHESKSQVEVPTVDVALPEAEYSIIESLQKARVSLLEWCLQLSDINASCRQRQDDGMSNCASKFECILMHGGNKIQPQPSPLISLVRFLLFIDDSSSTTHHFDVANARNGDRNNYDYIYRLRFCVEHRVHVTNNLVSVILNCVKMSGASFGPNEALDILEELMFNCRDRQDHYNSIKLFDLNVVWDLYKLAEYVPHESLERDLDTLTIRLVCPKKWWRITILIFIACSRCPDSLGIYLWQVFPTIRTLIKMAISERYIFPTADCDDVEKEVMIRNEALLQEKEAMVEECLFFRNTPYSDEIDAGTLDEIARWRSSLRVHQSITMVGTNCAAACVSEENSVPSVLKSLRKSIMIFDPSYDTARSPPQETLAIIESVVESFAMAKIFQECTEPDFLVMTLGETSRSRIEKAYKWLMPLISTHPDVISRLPPSASTFLLLRNRVEQKVMFKALTLPLRNHVSDSIIGRYGSEATKIVCNLLFRDLADKNIARRGCAHRLIHEALVECHRVGEDDENLWIRALCSLKYADSFIPSLSFSLVRALEYAKGRELRSYVLALKELIQSMNERPFVELDSDCNFSAVVCELLSVRPYTSCRLMNECKMIRDLFVDVLLTEFRSHIEKKRMYPNGVVLRVRVSRESLSQRPVGSQDILQIVVPRQLLLASIVVVSNIKTLHDDDDILHGTSNFDDCYPSMKEVNQNLFELVGFIVDTASIPEDLGSVGVASAYLMNNSGQDSIDANYWISLADSKCRFISSRSLLSAPVEVIPRLLMCTGIPHMSIYAVLSKLERMRKASTKPDSFYNQLFSSAALSALDFGHLSERILILEKLLFRMEAYMDSVSYNNSSLIAWLLQECALDDNKRTKNSDMVKVMPAYTVPTFLPEF